MRLAVARLLPDHHRRNASDLMMTTEAAIATGSLALLIRRIMTRTSVRQGHDRMFTKPARAPGLCMFLLANDGLILGETSTKTVWVMRGVTIFVSAADVVF